MSDKAKALFKKDIKIGYKTYKLIYGSDLVDNENNILFGSIDYREQVLKINTDYDAKTQKATILHEIIHGIDDYNGLNLAETQVICLGNNLLELILNNKELIKYMLEI